MKNRICKVEGCNSNYHAKGYCSRHYAQIKYYGKIRKITSHTPNKFIIKKDTVEIIIRDSKQLDICKTIIDIDDFDKVKNNRWGLNCNGYAFGNKKLLHRIIMDAKPNQLIDHKDRDILNNRKSNLRFVTKSMNCFNTKISKNNTSGCVGVIFDNRPNRKKWYATIKVNYKEIFLGSFTNFNDAVKARKEAELKYFGEIINR